MIATIDKPNRSHWLATDYERGGEISKEELYPILDVTGVPRVGQVRATFSVDRYRHTSGWSEWRIYLKDVEPSHGVGDATRKSISEACKPLIEAWLAGPEYVASRQNVAAHMVKRIILASDCRSYGLSNAEQELHRHQHELTTDDAERLRKAISLLEQAAELLENGE